ncbi:MAG: 6,7-dimethyl-8-ribityllumazine synthase, partial [Verrucomicrobiota bacterium]
MSLHAPEPLTIDGGELHFGIVAARYNTELVDALITRVQTVLAESGVPTANIEVERVPGSNEIPYLATMMAATRQYDCLIALGVVIAGGTTHHEIIAQSTAAVLHKVGMQTECPVINGILTVDSLDQAAERIIGSIDRGAEYARAALEMAKHKLKYTGMLD